MSPVEFLKEEYQKRGDCLPSGVFQEALEMERKAFWEDPILYSRIEYLIVTWNNDGTKTAGELTREIMKLIK